MDVHTDAVLAQIPTLRRFARALAGTASVGDTLVVVSALDGRDGHIDTLHVHEVRS